MSTIYMDPVSPWIPRAPPHSSLYILVARPSEQVHTVSLVMTTFSSKHKLKTYRYIMTRLSYVAHYLAYILNWHIILTISMCPKYFHCIEVSPKTRIYTSTSTSKGVVDTPYVSLTLNVNLFSCQQQSQTLI